MYRSTSSASVSLVLTLCFFAAPEATEAQGSGGCKATCTSEGCEKDEFQGIGGAIGIFDAECNLGDHCLVPCGGSEEDLELASNSFYDILMDLKRAETPEELTRVAIAYRNQLVLNASENMVLALGGCEDEDHFPISMVLLLPEQIETLEGLDLGTVEDLFPPD